MNNATNALTESEARALAAELKERKTMTYRISYVRETDSGIETETIHPAVDDRAEAFKLAEAAAGSFAEFAARGDHEWSYEGAKGLVVVTA